VADTDYYSVNDLIKMALEELGVQDAGQPIAAEDAQVLLDRWPSVVADLNHRDVGWFDEQAIETACLLPLAQVLAYNCRNAFSITDAAKVAELTAIGGKDGEAERTLKNIRRLRRPRQTMRTDIFNRYRVGRFGY
jgi:hypothetical protein